MIGSKGGLADCSGSGNPLLSFSKVQSDLDCVNSGGFLKKLTKSKVNKINLLNFFYS